ncbi:hypothetical protein [Streptodolium elevatio]|uniref:LPXTG cell wall anchor domain-containing protein n=1 Tax=Streptodolium elevatio TaxID=3157996 RepID=A0ABV3DWT5_9ACTN
MSGPRRARTPRAADPCPAGRRTKSPRGAVAAGRTAAAAAVLCAAAIGPAGAAESPAPEPKPADASAREITGPTGQRLWVSRTADVGAGETLVVRGSGYDANKGIYIAFCVDTGPGQLPTPCGGGADTGGATGASQWISSRPPSYGTELAKPYGPGGTFEVRITVTPTIGVEGAEGGVQDCAKVTCAVLSRADHTRTGDRSADVRVPVAFAAGGGDSDSGVGAPVLWGGGAAAAALLAGGLLFVRNRRGRRDADVPSGAVAAMPGTGGATGPTGQSGPTGATGLSGPAATETGS